MPEIVISDMQDGYLEWVDYVVRNGTPRAPRGRPTRNVRDLTVVLTNPERSLTHHVGRRASTKLAAVEALSLVSGVTYDDLMVHVAPNTAQFRSDDGTFHGAYGRRIRDAVPALVRRLVQDPDSRQCVASVFDSRIDLADGIRDVPCTVALSYELDGGRLHAKTTMRSNDVLWGVAHDVFMFTVLQRTIAEFMGVEVGEYRHNAYSSHVYLNDESDRILTELHPPTRVADVAPPLWDQSWGVVRDAPDLVADDWRVGPAAYADRLAVGVADSRLRAARVRTGNWWAQLADTWLQ